MYKTFTSRTILLFIVTILVLPAVLIWLEWSLREFHANRLRSDAHAMQSARDLLLNLDEEFKALAAVAGALASAPALQQADLASFQRQAEKTMPYSAASNFVLTDLHGQQLVNTLRPFGTSLPRHANPALLERVATLGRMQISDVYLSAVTRTGIMSICIPVLIEGKLTYFLEVGLATSALSRLLDSRQLPPDWIVAVVDASGTIAARSHLPAQYVGQKVKAELQQLMARAPQGHTQLATLEGVPVYISYLRSAASGWAVGIGVPRSSIDHALWRSLAFDLGAGALLLLLGTVLAGSASKQIRHAMQQLVDMSLALGNGAEPAPHRSRLREADQVAATLTAASARLRHSEAARLEAENQLRLNNAALEQRVRQRTEALQQSRHLIASIVEHMPAAVIVKRADDLRYEVFNHAGAQLLGKSPDQAIGHTDQDLYPAAEAGARMQADRAVIASGQILDIAQETVRDADGRTRHLHTKKMALLDNAGKPTHLLGISLDITDALRAAEQLQIAAVAFESQEPMMITDAESTILRINRAFTACTGYTEQEILGCTPRVLKSGRHDQAFYADMWNSIIERGAWQGECWDRRKNGEIYPAWTIISAIRDQHGVIRHYVCTQSDISSRKQAEDEIRQLAFYDPLTKLPNRRLLFERLRHAIESSRRSNLHGALMFIDLDNFKMLNDTLGHDQGDVLLREVAQRLPQCVRSADTVARLGGDEFVILLEDLSDTPEEAARQAQTVGEHVLQALNRPYQLDDRIYRCTPSIGATLISDHHHTIDEALRHADLAMYQAKAAGRNTMRFFEPQMQQAVNERAAMEHDLQQALQRGEFELYYQLQVDAAGQLTGAEALLRWNHPSRGLLAPDDFVALAEANGVILPLGQWALQQACQQLARWAQVPALRGVTLAVNVSAYQFRQADFVTQVTTALQTASADPQRLKLELTENLMLDDFGSIAEKMNRLQAIGIGFALDDFGMGYSSLSYLKRLPLQQLKIDRSFIHDVLQDANDAAIARTIIVLGHTLGMEVIAEGVETLAQYDFLAANKCNVFQGFLFSRPLPEQQFHTLVQQRYAA